MGRDTLELADESLFIENIKNAVTAADPFLLTRARCFPKEKAFGFNSAPFEAADPFSDRNGGAPLITNFLFASLMSQDRFTSGEVHKKFGRHITAALEDRSFQFITRIEKSGFIDATQRKQEEQL